MCVPNSVQGTLCSQNLRQSAQLELHVLIRDGRIGVGETRATMPPPPPPGLKPKLFLRFRNIHMTAFYVWLKQSKPQCQENGFFYLFLLMLNPQGLGASTVPAAHAHTQPPCHLEHLLHTCYVDRIQLCPKRKEKRVRGNRALDAHTMSWGKSHLGKWLWHEAESNQRNRKMKAGNEDVAFEP